MDSAAFYAKKEVFPMFDERHQPKLLNDYLAAEDNFLLSHIKKGTNLVDMGCSTGRHLVLLSNLCNRLVGIDFSKVILEKARQETASLGNTELFLENATKTHFPNCSFDYAICMFNTLGNMQRPLQIKLLEEMKRIVKERGKMTISVYSENANEMQNEYYRMNGLKIVREEEDCTYLEEGLISERFTVPKLEKLFASIGLRAKISNLTSISYICELAKGD